MPIRNFHRCNKRADFPYRATSSVFRIRNCSEFRYGYTKCNVKSCHFTNLFLQIYYFLQIYLKKFIFTNLFFLNLFFRPSRGRQMPPLPPPWLRACQKQYWNVTCLLVLIPEKFWKVGLQNTTEWLSEAHLEWYI